MMTLSFCGHLMRHPLVEPFHLSDLLQMPNGHRMGHTEFLSNFPCGCQRIRFDEPLSQSSVSDGRPLLFPSSRLS